MLALYFLIIRPNNIKMNINYLQLWAHTKMLDAFTLYKMTSTYRWHGATDCFPLRFKMHFTPDEDQLCRSCLRSGCHSYINMCCRMAGMESARVMIRMGAGRGGVSGCEEVDVRYCILFTTVCRLTRLKRSRLIYILIIQWTLME